MKTADDLGEYLYHAIFEEREIKYYMMKHFCEQSDTVFKKYLLKKYRDNIAIIGEALLRMVEEGEYH